MGKATPFEGEIDKFGNALCGQSFMGGTLCSLPPKHEGFCGSDCQNCGGDWLNDTCDCYKEDEDEEPSYAHCQNCGDLFSEDDGAGEFAYCAACGCEKNELGHGIACHLLANHAGPCKGGKPEEGPTDEELAEAYRSLGVSPPV